MAVIWRDKNGEKRYITGSGLPPTMKEIDLAEKYDEVLKEKIREASNTLCKQNFFEMQDKAKKWYLLGKALQFLDDLPLRFKCDPDLKNTWRAFYDLVPRFAPTENIPSDKERVFGRRNHFYLSYHFGKLPWEKVKGIGWSNWLDIYASFSPDMERDSERLIEWVVSRASSDRGITRNKLRTVLKVLRGIAGQRAKIPRDTTVLSKKELYRLLDKELRSF